MVWSLALVSFWDQLCPEDSFVRRLWVRMCLPHGSQAHSLPDMWESESISCSVVSDCDHIDCSPPGASICESLPVRILKWIVIPFSRESS